MLPMLALKWNHSCHRGYAGTILQMSGVKSVKEVLWLTVAIFFALLILQGGSVILVDKLGRRATVLISLGCSSFRLSSHSSLKHGH